jgi:hypothetical protein
MTVESDIERFGCEGCGRSWPWLRDSNGSPWFGRMRLGPRTLIPGIRYHVPPRGDLVCCTLGEARGPHKPAFRMMSHEPRTWLIKDRYTVFGLRGR